MINILFFTLLMNAQAQAPVSLTEKSLSELSLSTTPQWDSIEAAFLDAKNQSQQLNDKFRPEVFSEAQYSETREKAIIQFQPIWSPLKTAQIGVRQNFRGGVALSAAVGMDQRSATTPTGKFDNVTTNVLRLDVSVDLWKDLFGRISKAQSKSADLSQERANLEKEIQQKAFVLGLRRTYWSLVANNEQIKVYEGLKKISEQQVADARRRRGAGVTDDGEVARYEAQVASRQGSLLYYQYQREILLKQLKTLLPDLQGRDVVMAPYDVPKMIETVLACTAVIASHSKVPYEFTKYDEVIGLLKKTQSEQAKLASSYDDVNLKFIASVQEKGVASKSNGNSVNSGSYGAAIDDWKNNNRTGYSAGLQLVVPIGKGETKNTQELLAKKRYDAQINQNEANIEASHNQLVKVIGILTSVVKSQKENTSALERRLKVQNRKFLEARVSVNDLILDQDALLNSNLTTINTQLEIINTIFDYLSVFTETPCEFNRI